MARNSNAASAGSDQRSLTWLKIHMFDVVTLFLTTVLALKFWWAYLGLHDVLLLATAIVASFAETVRRLVVARRHWQRPATFFSDRRSDLLAAILIGTGPWPMLPVLVLPLTWNALMVPIWLRVFASTGMIVLSARRLSAVLESSAGQGGRYADPAADRGARPPHGFDDGVAVRREPLTYSLTHRGRSSPNTSTNAPALSSGSPPTP